MKAKLLKKLRKEAAKMIYVVETNSKYPYKVVWLGSTVWSEHQCYKMAEKYCIFERDKYILDVLLEKYKSKGKKLF